MRFAPGNTKIPRETGTRRAGSRTPANGFMLLDVILALTLLVIGTAAITGGFARAVQAALRVEQRFVQHTESWNHSAAQLFAPQDSGGEGGGVGRAGAGIGRGSNE